MRARTTTFAIAAAAIASATAVPARAASYEVFYTAPSDLGLHPSVGAVANGLIYGTDPAAGNGLVFTVALHGKTYTALHGFNGTDGSTPNARLAVIGDKIYGTTQGGGSGGAGTVFGMASTGALLWSHGLQGGTEGSSPYDGLAVGPGNVLYGTTSQGALSPGNGTLFRVNRVGHFTVMYKFRSRADGHCPFTGVVTDTAGDIFGTTVGLGFGGEPMGSVWKALPGAKPLTQAEFQNNGDGEYPEITPTLDGAGNVWGVIDTGTSNGAIWELTPSGIVAKYSFSGGADGSNPNGPLLLGSDGNLYGTAAGGGKGHGTVFMITPQAQFSVVHAFVGGADGGSPIGNLAADAAGHIYGGTAEGTIFRVTP